MTARSPFLAGLAVLGLAVAGCGGGARAQRALVRVPSAPASTTTTSTSTSTSSTVPATTTTVVPVDPNVTALAHVTRDIPRFATPSLLPNGMVPANWYGYPTVLPVIAQQPGWLQVRLAQRPNQSVAWIHSRDVTLSATNYRIVVNLTTARLQVSLEGKVVMDFPAGIGTPTDPTVTGHYFVAIHAAPPNPGYGPFVLATSAHSDAITDWEGLGDAIIAIHGPIDGWSDSRIGTTGARISHGCIRLHNRDLALLASIPVGTPIDITP
jgi:lipoprotein-anchoring transpeptidase ErfK/SrfK